MKKPIFAFLLILSLLMSLPLPVLAVEEERGIAFTEDAYKPDAAYDFLRSLAQNHLLEDISGHRYDAERIVFWMDGKAPI